MEFKYDTQLLLEGENLDEDVIHDYIQDNIPWRLPAGSRWRRPREAALPH